MAEELPKQDLLIKLLGMTQSSNDAECLVAIRKSNELLRSANWTWEKLIHGKIKVFEDPFKSVSAVRQNTTNGAKMTTPAPQQDWRAAANAAKPFAPPPPRPQTAPPPPRSTYTPPQSQDWRTVAKAGRTIEAIKIFRVGKNVGLAEAKAVVDNYISSIKAAQRPSRPFDFSQGAPPMSTKRGPDIGDL